MRLAAMAHMQASLNDVWRACAGPAAEQPTEEFDGLSARPLPGV
jgi:hypothetical protein